MSVVKIILSIVYFIICLVLIILTLKQSKGDEGLSSTITGAGSDNFYEQNKGRTKEGRMTKWTIILGVAFVVLTIALGTVYVM
ncbi:MAG: preprotein translocase subunit SecG [Clostridia bacterium]|nr:preprotein translocase subunit SecG [Clostridia bacterium]